MEESSPVFQLASLSETINSTFEELDEEATDLAYLFQSRDVVNFPMFIRTATRP